MSDRTQRLAIYAGALLLAALGAGALRLARRLPPIAGLSPQVAPPLPLDIGLRFTEVAATGRQAGQVAWTLTAPRIDTARDRSRLDFSGGIQAVLRESGQPRATLSAPTATYEVAAQRLTVAGTVRAHVSPPPKAPAGGPPDPTAALGAFEVATGLALWDIGARTLRCPGEVTVRLKRGEARGENLSLDLRTRDFTLHRFRGRFRVEEETL